MRGETNPGDLSVRLAFGQTYGMGPERGKVSPRLEVTDQKSGRQLEIDLTHEDLVEMLAGGAAEVPADRVTGFRGVRDWGKTHVHVTRLVTTQPSDWNIREGEGARKLPHVAAVIAEMEADGYRCDAPRRNNGGQWVLIGRKYEDLP